MTTSSLYPTDIIICKIRQWSSEFQTQILPRNPGRFSNASQRRAPVGRWNIPLSMVDGVSIHPVTTKVQSSFLTQLSERKETAQEFHYEANGDFKTVRWLWQEKTEDGSTTLQLLHNINLNDSLKRRKPVQNKNIPKNASFFQ